MRIEGIEVTVAALSLRVPILSAGVSHSDKTTLFLRVLTDEGSGWGECSAYPGARLPDPTVEAVEPSVVDRVVKRLFEACDRGQLIPAASVVETCIDNGSVSEQSVAGALEMAVLDAELRSTSGSLAALLGAERREVETGELVGIPPGATSARWSNWSATPLTPGRAGCVSRSSRDGTMAPSSAVRERFGDAVLQADANGSFEPGSAAGLRGLDAYHLRCLEQPFPAENLHAHRALADTMSTPIALDESLWSLERVREALDVGACRVACLKPGRMGGVFAVVAAAQAAPAPASTASWAASSRPASLGRSTRWWPGGSSSASRAISATRTATWWPTRSPTSRVGAGPSG